MKAQLKSLINFEGVENAHIKEMTKVLDRRIVPRMKTIFVLYAMSHLVSALQIRLKLGVNNVVPISLIMVCLAKSGARKTSSVRACNKALKGGQDMIDDLRESVEKIRAKNIGTKFDRDAMPNMESSLSTRAGLLNRLAHFSRDRIGTLSLFIDELVTAISINEEELESNIDVVSQLFDSGVFNERVLKGTEAQVEKITDMAMTTLLLGTEATLLSDDKLLRSLNNIFESMASRRAFFVYASVIKDEFSSVEEALAKMKELQIIADNATEKMSKVSQQVVEWFSEEQVVTISLSEEASELNNIYSLYCETRGDEMPESPAKIEQTHRAWKTLKLAGVLSVFKREKQISKITLLEAINISEDMADDYIQFIKKAGRQPFEKLADYFREADEIETNAVLKMKWAKNNVQIEELIDATNKELKGLKFIELDYDKIVASREITVSKHRISYVPTANLKQIMETNEIDKTQAKGLLMSHATEGFRVIEVDKFEDMMEPLMNDCLYTPHVYKGGVRGDVIGGVTFIVLDVDDSSVDINTAFDLLGDYNNMMCTTSDNTNPMKFRIVLQIDVEMELTRTQWGKMMGLVEEYIGIDIDKLELGRAFLGYANSRVLVNTDGEPFPMSELIPKIKLNAQSGMKKKIPFISNTDFFNQRVDKFDYLYKTKTEDIRVRASIYRALKHAWRAGLTEEQFDVIYEEVIAIHGEPVKEWTEAFQKQKSKEFERTWEQVRKQKLIDQKL